MWDERYAEGWAYGTEPNDFLRESLGWLTLGPALCLAEGQGRNAVFLAANGFEVTAVDSSRVGLACASRLATERGVRISTVQADLGRYRIQEGHFQVIVSIFCHLPPEVRRDVHARVVRGLAPGGIFLLEAYRPEQASRSTGGPREASLCVTLAQLRAELGGLDILLEGELERDVLEGPYHNGQGAVVQLIAQKPRR